MKLLMDFCRAQKKLLLKFTVLLFFTLVVLSIYSQEFVYDKTFTGHKDDVTSVNICPNERYLASASADNTIKLWDIKTGKLIRTFTGHENGVTSIDISPKGNILASGSLDKTIKLWNIQNGEQVKTLLHHRSDLYSVSFNKSGNLLGSTCENSARLWDSNSGESIQTVLDYSMSGIVYSLSFSPDGKTVASVERNRNIKLWEINSGNEIKNLSGHSRRSSIYSLCFSPGGNYLASASNDNTVKLWEISNGECVKTFTGHNDDVNSLSFSPDGNFLASGSKDNTINIWDLGSGKLYQTLTDHNSSVNSVTYSSNGNFLASGSSDNTIKLWHITLSYKVKQFVENSIKEWEKKGEFERTTDYQKRVNETNRSIKIEEFTNEAISFYKEKERSLFKREEINLKGDYDANNESYLIESRLSGEAVINVPISEAQSFRDNLYQLQFTDIDFIIKDERFVLSEFGIYNPENNNTYHWDSHQTSTYSFADIEYNFSPIEHIEIPESEVRSTTEPTIIQTQLRFGKPDVAINIPENPQTNSNTYAVVIANENYRQEVNVHYAINDGKVFKEYCKKTLGIPAQNIRFAKDATFGEIRGAISWITQVIDAFDGEARVIFYYAGHGMPGETDGTPYLLPVDGSSSDFETAISLSDLYSRLTEHPSKSVTVFLDACFSGATRDDEMLVSARAVRVRPRETALQGNIVVFSSATGEETAFPYHEKQHGIFTYFLLKKLQETKGDVDYKTLSDYIITNVRRQSITVNRKSQTPQVNTSPEMKDKWKGLGFW